MSNFCIAQTIRIALCVGTGMTRRILARYRSRCANLVKARSKNPCNNNKRPRLVSEQTVVKNKRGKANIKGKHTHTHNPNGRQIPLFPTLQMFRRVGPVEDCSKHVDHWTHYQVWDKRIANLMKPSKLLKKNIPNSRRTCAVQLREKHTQNCFRWYVCNAFSVHFSYACIIFLFTAKLLQEACLQYSILAHCIIFLLIG